MPTKQKPSESAPARIPVAPQFIEPKDGLMLVYANHVQISQSAFDVKLGFGEILGVEEGKARILKKVSVTITWLEAKILNDLLSRVLTAYESANGPLAPPKLIKLGATPSESPKP